MPTQVELLEVERSFWMGGPEVYHRHADSSCLVVFSQMAQVMGRDAIASTAEAGRWTNVHLTPIALTTPAADMAILTYECSAVRRNGTPHHAYVTSAYVRRPGGWKLTFHQQTEVAHK